VATSHFFDTLEGYQALLRGIVKKKQIAYPGKEYYNVSYEARGKLNDKLTAIYAKEQLSLIHGMETCEISGYGAFRTRSFRHG
jgi:hypothetical protein